MPTALPFGLAAAPDDARYAGSESAPQSYTGTITGVLVGQDGTNNTVSFLLAHSTSTATGELVVNIEEARSICPGAAG